MIKAYTSELNSMLGTASTARSFPQGLSPDDIVQRRICAIDLMVALCSCREEPLPKPRAAASWESFGVGNAEESKEAMLRQPSPKPSPISLICDKIQCIFFCTGMATKKTFSRPAKMMDHVEAHLRREKVETGCEMVRCRHQYARPPVLFSSMSIILRIASRGYTASAFGNRGMLGKGRKGSFVGHISKHRGRSWYWFRYCQALSKRRLFESFRFARWYIWHYLRVGQKHPFS
jgi:hypothetical protein